MFRRLTLLVAPVIAVGALMFADTPTASAQGFSIRIGNYGSSFGAHRNSFSPYSYGYGTPSYRSYRSYRSYSPSYGRSSYGHGSYHPSRPHYDYYPPQVIRHGNHYDVIPGHSHLHHGNHHH
ncbi:hypothetical protein LOC67_25060 [Stieleria sp. JC731]|uniref:hypothetical protein n=1 Tax=Pirellulaceae TaxID=2691357 RepID=UPI001E305ED7|nr:hypothetical protein [Stieleria sp. JC731]MCC9603834.1 hypothetical protein [Stieleria sp. JC731]